MSKAEPASAEAPEPKLIKNPEPLAPVDPVKKGKGKETYKEAIFRLENSGLTVRQSVVQADLLVEAGEVHKDK